MITGIPAPRFLIVGSAPRYGARDEIIGSFSHVEAAAETQRWADREADRVFAAYGGYEGSDIEVRVIDTAPRSAWSPAIAQAKRDDAAREALEAELYPLPF